MRKLRYSVAMSLDGFIAGPEGEYDWMSVDSGIDFGAIYANFDTGLMGRRTYEVARTRGDLLKGMGMKLVIVSATLNPAEHTGFTILSKGIPEAVAALKAEPGKDIWLFGGEVLFRSLLDAGLVDGIDISVFPVMLGSGVNLMPEGGRCELRLEASKALASGVLMLEYAVIQRGGAD